MAFDIQVTNHADSTIYQRYGSAPTSFPVIGGHIANSDNIPLRIGNMHGFQDANDIGELGAGQTAVRNHYLTLSDPEAVFSTNMNDFIYSSRENFWGVVYFQYAYGLENHRYVDEYAIVLPINVYVAYAPPNN